MSLKKITEKKREFSIETIASAIHAEDLISSLKNKYKDPLILYRRKMQRKNKRNQNKSSSLEPESFSLNKVLVHQYLKPQQNEEKSNININNILPVLSPINLKMTNTKEYIATSGMFKQKEFYKDKYQKLKLGNVMNLKTNNDSFYQNLYPKIENIRKFNDKYNLNLDLKFYNEEKPLIKIFRRKSIAQKDIMNYLFNKYIIKSRQENNNKNNSKEDSKSNENNILLNNKGEEMKKKNSLTIDEILEKNNINKFLSKQENKDNTKTFITKIQIKNRRNEETKENYKTANTLKPRTKIFSNFLDKNKNIIKHDQKIYVDCLYSEIISNLDKNKLIYNQISNVKTNYAITKEPSYKKIKKFETIIDDIIKNPNDLTISVMK